MSNEVTTYTDMERWAATLAKSGLFGVKDPAQAFALMAIAQAEGLHPAKAMQQYHVIEGKPALKADALLARFQSAGGSVKWTEYTDTRVSAVFSHPQGGPLEVDWTIDRAKQAGLSGRPMWAKYPRQMLRSRVISEGVRAVFPGLNAGMYTAEEVQDMVLDEKPALTVEPAPAPERMSDEEAGELQHAIATAPDLDTLRQVYATAYSKAKRDGNHGALLMFEATKDARKQALQEAA